MDSSDDMSSLMALVNSHLSEMSVQEVPTRNIASSIYETTGVRLPMPKFGVMCLNSDQPFKTDPIVVQQIVNTIKASEISQQQEVKVEHNEIQKAKLKEKMSILRGTVSRTSQQMDYQIDLSDAIIDKNEHLKLEKLKKEKPQKAGFDFTVLQSSVVNLQSLNVKRKGVSVFGKVFCAHYGPLIRPCAKSKVVLHVSPYLQGPSPDDIILERKKHEVNTFDIMSYYGLEPSISIQKPKTPQSHETTLPPSVKTMPHPMKTFPQNVKTVPQKKKKRNKNK